MNCRYNAVGQSHAKFNKFVLVSEVSYFMSCTDVLTSIKSTIAFVAIFLFVLLT